MPVETLEEAARAQEQMEDFARRAHSVRLAVEALEDALLDLGAWPENIGIGMPQLRRLADDIADWSADWAEISNADFDPSMPAA